MQTSNNLKTRIYGMSEKNSQASSSIEEAKDSSMRPPPIDTDPVLRQNCAMGAKQQTASEIDVDQDDAAENGSEKLFCYLKTKLGKYKKHAMIIDNDILRLQRASSSSNI